MIKYLYIRRNNFMRDAVYVGAYDSAEEALNTMNEDYRYIHDKLETTEFQHIKPIFDKLDASKWCMHFGKIRGMGKVVQCDYAANDDGKLESVISPL